ncbi:glycerol-3-phosphate acyltransferase [Myxococcus llanfairpwllgwyngyllgogerychwyrndrobwllllantysiliogogogochensis]|uniref:Glycerol-3-phosphate acyltransferase n=1 Tax=Myxococcus llanfairpwllgwyngyllgogerychwyrndrobwllllantysiliogogogochensis TaxID=2590453 RepID=A0A540WZ63_9BACT|nr:1-acyl-sn-glycerol-3-phosphate acyltransferase [Myxococcus llanfairpwllgwyngyllgogerychwyrndrobwllllantysiliogogogochensis]TQF14286.1 glycerol-3-phosphate acyltransferase [Myxococcus llanfairpwllgwyngyllgogerychwyrndrobwllllantysiliogogogochensis]
METALSPSANQGESLLKAEFGPMGRALGARYLESVHFPPEAEDELRNLHAKGFVVHVMRSTAWVNFLYLTWAMVRRTLPPIRAVSNLRPWFTKPWRQTKQSGAFQERFEYAQQNGGSGLVFLRRTALMHASGKETHEDPFPALVELARKSDRPVYLVPELFVWEKSSARLKPNWVDVVFGSPEAPGFLHSMLAFFRNYKRAQFRVGEPIDLRAFAEENPKDSVEVLARKVRSTLHVHLSRETRAVFGPPAKPHERVIDETLRDRQLRKVVDEQAVESNRKPESVLREARRNLEAIAAKPSPTTLAFVAPVLEWVFNRIYDGMHVDEAGLHRALKAATRAPIVLCPSHKSHVDYLVMSWVLWNRGYAVPLVAAGANLSFWPLGSIFRRCGAFFLRRSFKGDKVYAASFKAYVRKLVHDGIHQEFFPEGGRSRTGKLLAPKLGMFTWQVESVLEGARNDLLFVPVAIDYEKVVESGSYSKELAGGEKKPEDLKALLSTPKVLAARYGRIHLGFDEPISLLEFMKERGLNPDEPVTDEQKKGLVRALGNRVMYGISKVSTVTPHALVSTSLLAHRRRGLTQRELADRISILRRIAQEDGAPQSRELGNAPSNPETMGPIQDAMRTFIDDEMVRTQEAKGDVIYQVEDNRRPEMSFYKNTLMNLVSARSLVANAMLAAGSPAPYDAVKARALFLSRLFKVEFIYRVNTTFDTIFAETVERLVRMGLVINEGESLRVAPEPHAQPELEFLADLLRDYLEAYLLAAMTLNDVANGVAEDRKAFIRLALETGRAEYHAGRVTAAESLAKVTLENAVTYLQDQKLLVEEDKKLKLGPQATDAEARRQLADAIREYLKR